MKWIRTSGGYLPQQLDDGVGGVRPPQPVHGLDHPLVARWIFDDAEQLPRQAGSVEFCVIDRKRRSRPGEWGGIVALMPAGKGARHQDHRDTERAGLADRT